MNRTGQPQAHAPDTPGAAGATPRAAVQPLPAWVLGLGLRERARPETLQALWLAAQQQLAASVAASPALPAAVAAVAVLQGKEWHPALRAWLAALAPLNPFPVQLQAIARAQLAAQPVASHSPRIQARYGTGCVAEACALAAAGPQARLLLARTISPDRCATLAVAGWLPLASETRKSP